MLLGQHALRAEYHLHVVEPFRKSQQKLNAARKSDSLERCEAGKQILPAPLLTARQLGAKDRQRLSGGLQPRLGKKIIGDDSSSFVDSLADQSEGRFAFLSIPDPSERRSSNRDLIGGNT